MGDFGGGIGSVGSLVSVRSTSRTANEFDGIIAPTDQYGFPPEDYDYDSGYDDVLDGSSDNGDEVTTPVVILTAEQLQIWRNENGISGDEGDCHYCNNYNCHTGRPAPPDENPKCNDGNYPCQYYTGRPSTNLDANDRDVCSYNHCPD